MAIGMHVWKKQCILGLVLSAASGIYRGSWNAAPADEGADYTLWAAGKRCETEASLV